LSDGAWIYGSRSTVSNSLHTPLLKSSVHLRYDLHFGACVKRIPCPGASHFNAGTKCKSLVESQVITQVKTQEPLDIYSNIFLPLENRNSDASSKRQEPFFSLLWSNKLMQLSLLVPGVLSQRRPPEAFLAQKV
jgi:hypothetical protein